MGQPLTDTIRLHFLYGSAPAKGFKHTERKHFGGIKGGHVSIEGRGMVLDFLPGNCPILPENKNPSGGYCLNPGLYWDTATTTWASIAIPVTASQMRELQQIFFDYAQRTPYDYAVFGMRCAAASYDVLSEIGIVKKIPGRKNILLHFYPKLLRKKMFKLAEEEGYPVTRHTGKPSRKWERDKGIF